MDNERNEAVVEETAVQAEVASTEDVVAQATEEIVAEAAPQEVKKGRGRPAGSTKKA